MPGGIERMGAGMSSDYDLDTDSFEAISEALVPVGVIEHTVYRT